jgi:F0F1-type ATP synthase membrane subunit c/vacuolar-type H+-ATPase subunit K
MMSFLRHAAAFAFFAISACALLAAIVVQYALAGKIGRIGLDPKFLQSSEQRKKFLIFGLFLAIAFFALVVGRSLQ